MRELARRYTDDAISTLATIMLNPDASTSSRVKAAEALLDRGWGKATQPITGEDGGPVRFLFDGPAPMDLVEWEKKHKREQ